MMTRLRDRVVLCAVMPSDAEAMYCIGAISKEDCMPGHRKLARYSLLVLLATVCVLRQATAQAEIAAETC